MSGSDQAAVIDMNDIEEMEIMDDDDSRRRKETEKPKDPMSNLRENMTTYVWNEGRRRAESAIKTYTNVDMLRPYFDVEPYEVVKRLGRSFVPVKPAYRENNRTKIPSELYGPTMICFTLVALLLFEMKSSGHRVQEGTLMGSALVTCFGYWIGISALLWVVAYICSTHIRVVQIFTLLGYGLSGHCVVILLSTVVHTVHNHAFFYFIWAVFGGLCTLRMVGLLVSRTPGRTERLVMIGFVVIIHLLFLIYLHFAYHRIVEDLSEVFNDKQVLHPVEHVPIVPMKAKLLGKGEARSATMASKLRTVRAVHPRVNISHSGNRSAGSLTRSH